jgi:endonuclease YncB( thermonuclease family)
MGHSSLISHSRGQAAGCRQTGIASIGSLRMTRIKPHLLLVSLLVSQPTNGETQSLSNDLPNQPDVVDGDTFRDPCDGQSYRLQGIDACEKDRKAITTSGQHWLCGAKATAWLTTTTLGQSVASVVSHIDRYGRRLARCGTPAIPDLSAEMIRQGRASYIDSMSGPAFRLSAPRNRDQDRSSWHLDECVRRTLALVSVPSGSNRRLTDHRPSQGFRVSTFGLNAISLQAGLRNFDSVSGSISPTPIQSHNCG